MVICTNNIMKTIDLILLVHRLVTNKCNLLIIIMLSVFSCCTIKSHPENNLIQYDNLTKKYVYIFVEKMPNYKGGDNAFMTDFSRFFHYDFKLNNDIQTKLRVQFVIDKRGRLIGARIYNKKADELTSFEKEGLKALESLQSWEAGKYKNENVAVILTRTINIDFR